MGVGLVEQGPGLALEGVHGVGARGEAHGRLVEGDDPDEGVGELGRVSPCLPSMLRQPSTVAWVRSA